MSRDPIRHVYGWSYSSPGRPIDELTETGLSWLRRVVGPYSVTHVSFVGEKLSLSMYRNRNRLNRVVALAEANGWVPDGPHAAITFGGKTGGLALVRTAEAPNAD